MTILLGDGTGNFTEPPTSPEGAGLGPQPSAGGDFNLDGRLDLATANFFGDNVTILLNKLNIPPPTINCPANITAVTAQTCPPAAGVVVNFTTPAPPQNCAGASTVCSPSSGATFPVGTTTVTCTATSGANNTAMCSFTVTVFNACLQDDARPNNVVLFNTFTGDYRFCCGSTLRLAGRGSVLRQGCVFTLQHNAPDRRVFAKIDFSARRGNASLQNFSGPGCTISDTDIRNNTCNCSALP